MLPNSKPTCWGVKWSMSAWANYADSGHAVVSTILQGVSVQCLRLTGMRVVWMNMKLNSPKPSCSLYRFIESFFPCWILTQCTFWEKKPMPPQWWIEFSWLGQDSASIHQSLRDCSQTNETPALTRIGAVPSCQSISDGFIWLNRHAHHCHGCASPSDIGFMKIIDNPKTK